MRKSISNLQNRNYAFRAAFGVLQGLSVAVSGCRGGNTGGTQTLELAADTAVAVAEEAGNASGADVKAAVEKVFSDNYANKNCKFNTYPCFTDSLNAAIARVIAHDKIHHSQEIGFIDYDIWTQCQDPSDDVTATAKNVRLNDSRTSATLEVEITQNKGAFKKTIGVSAELVKGKWLISDMDSLRTRIQQYLATDAK